MGRSVPIGVVAFVLAAAIVVTAGVSFALVGGGGSPGGQTATETPTATGTPPPAVQEARPLGVAFKQNLTEAHPNARVFITQQGHLVVSYDTTAASGPALRQELHTIADTYAAVVNETGHEARTLTITAGGVKATVPGPTAQAYARGDINREAYFETIEVSDVERRTPTS